MVLRQSLRRADAPGTPLLFVRGGPRSKAFSTRSASPMRCSVPERRDASPSRPSVAVAASAAQQRRAVGVAEVDDRRRLARAGTGVDHRLHLLLQPVADRLWVVHRLGSRWRDQRRRQQRLAELLEQRLGDAVVGTRRSIVRRDGMRDPARHLLVAPRMKVNGPGVPSLSMRYPVVDPGVACEARTGRGTAASGDASVDPADGRSDRRAAFVVEGDEGVARVGGHCGHAAPVQDLHPPA